MGNTELRARIGPDRPHTVAHEKLFEFAPSTVEGSDGLPLFVFLGQVRPARVDQVFDGGVALAILALHNEVGLASTGRHVLNLAEHKIDFVLVLHMAVRTLNLEIPLLVL